MVKKISRAILLVSLGILALTALLVLKVLYEHHTATLLLNQRAELMIAAQGVESYGRSFLYETDMGNCRVTLIDTDGTVIYDSSQDEKDMDNHSQREEFKEAMETGYGESVRYSGTLAEKQTYCAKTLSDGSCLRTAKTSVSLWALLVGMIRPILIIAAVALIFSILLAKRVSKKIVDPIIDIDIENPLDTELYWELQPLLLRIDRQNTEIRNQIRALKGKNKEIAYITENVSDGILILDNKEKVISANKKAKELFHCVENQYFPYFCKDAQCLDVIDSAKKGTSSSCCMEIGNSAYRMDAAGTESQEEESAVFVLIKELSDEEHTGELRREFSANVSHELKTPLTSIMGSAEIIESGIAKPEDIPYFAGKIRKESQRLLMLVQDIIRLSRLDEGISYSEFTDVELSNLCENVKAELQQKAEERGISLNFELINANILGCEPVLHEMLFNLIDNAITYNVKDGKVFVTIEKQKDSIDLCVKDTGIGIEQQHQKRIFERFYRVDKSHSKETGGTGLGLSIVKHGAQLHSAEVKLTSVPGKGTTVCLRFPKNEK